MTDKFLTIFTESRDQISRTPCAAFTELLLCPVTACISTLGFSSFALHILSNSQPVRTGSSPLVNAPPKPIETPGSTSFLTDQYYSGPSSAPSADPTCSPCASSHPHHVSRTSLRVHVSESCAPSSHDKFPTFQQFALLFDFEGTGVTFQPYHRKFSFVRCSAEGRLRYPTNSCFPVASPGWYATLEIRDKRVICAPDSKLSAIVLKKIDCI